MAEKDFLKLKNYQKKNGLKLSGRPSYLSNDGQYLGGSATSLKDRKILHYVAKYDGTWAAYNMQEMVDAGYDDETRTWESFIYSTGNSAISMVAGPEKWEWMLKGYDGYPEELFSTFKIGDKWDPQSVCLKSKP